MEKYFSGQILNSNLTYQHILFSRSRSVDYRWMILPDHIARNDLNILKNLYLAYDRHKRRFPYQDTNLKPLFLLKLSNSFLLIQLGKTQYSDSFNRQIFGLWGISVPEDAEQQLRIHLRQIITESEIFLNPFKLKMYQFLTADKLNRFVAEKFHISTQISNNQLVHINTNSAKELPAISFNPEGFQVLLDFIAMPPNPLVSIAFGATPAMLRIVHPVKITALV